MSDFRWAVIAIGVGPLAGFTAGMLIAWAIAPRRWKHTPNREDR